MGDLVKVEDHGNWFEITLNRPDRLNSFNDAMHGELQAGLDKARDERKRAVLLTGAGRGFCAGQDLGDRDPAKMERKPDLSHTIRAFWAPTVKKIHALEMPVVCAVNGVAAGAGSSLALSCDVVLAAESAKFIQSFSKVGLLPDTGGSWHLTRLLGPARAMALSLTADPLPATRAAEWGLIWKALPDEKLFEEARAFTARLASGPTLGLASIKKAIQKAAEQPLNDHMEYEADLMKACGESNDYAEGVAAFLEKRAANFKGH